MVVILGADRLHTSVSPCALEVFYLVLVELRDQSLLVDEVGALEK